MLTARRTAIALAAAASLAGIGAGTAATASAAPQPMVITKGGVAVANVTYFSSKHLFCVKTLTGARTSTFAGLKMVSDPSRGFVAGDRGGDDAETCGVTPVLSGTLRMDGTWTGSGGSSSTVVTYVSA